MVQTLFGRKNKHFVKIIKNDQEMAWFQNWTLQNATKDWACLDSA